MPPCAANQPLHIAIRTIVKHLPPFPVYIPIMQAFFMRVRMNENLIAAVLCVRFTGESQR
ncbi:hypothetical protein BOMU111920_04860 [Bordetella muralis]